MAFKLTVLLFIAAHVCAALAFPKSCACTRNLRPVCGSNGKTYNNQCLLDCERERSNGELTMVKEGSCDEDLQSCVCTFEYKPVCGTDGTTYPNRCSLKCQRSYSPNLDVEYNGECVEKVKVAEIPPCTCTREAKPVCGSDGNTYANDCLLNCATAKNSMLSIAHWGRCSDEVKVVEQPQSDEPVCSCTRNLLPVCGANGVTYNNECLLNCAGTQVARQGPCDPRS